MRSVAAGKEIIVGELIIIGDVILRLRPYDPLRDVIIIVLINIIAYKIADQRENYDPQRNQHRYLDVRAFLFCFPLNDLCFGAFNSGVFS